MYEEWRRPKQWARAGGLLVVPYAVVAWFTLAVTPVPQIAFGLAVVGILGVVAATIRGFRTYRRGAVALVGVLLLLAGLALFGLDPFPAQIAGLNDWWPSAITQPQTVLSGYWTLVALGAVLTGAGLLVWLLLTALLVTPRPRR
ncbi:hypothetical protein DEI81_14765 [Curtobacterium sp. MCBD17_013]|uniref:hypothetical protein n=1 Tax=Curtobacterium sp. MCBD17_013 TaxID=2175668 RepID=UPI000DA84532|nr:hypothetical protein [Curtobacterium sp. MCBD17_013]PZF58125.1 hypothetical protein DEI81_14765 [Curtobacterium sp. MCBD17_013]